MPAWPVDPRSVTSVIRHTALMSPGATYRRSAWPSPRLDAVVDETDVANGLQRFVRRLRSKIGVGGAEAQGESAVAALDGVVADLDVLPVRDVNAVVEDERSAVQVAVVNKAGPAGHGG